MLRIRIDNVFFEVPDGTTVLEAARIAGHDLPVLCHSEGVPHYSSCMVCMVKDRKKNAFFPSCSAPVQNDMDIDVSGEDVVSLRRKAVELLLSEHRAECEAPCRVVCPAGYNIPLMNRFLSSDDIEAVYHLVATEMGSGELNCVNCKAFCENACRRKKIDEPVTIRNTRLFIASEIKQNGYVKDTGIPVIERIKRFSSRTGKIEPGEQQEWLQECSPTLTRHKEITDISKAVHEAAACMHCDCRAADGCRLREVAELLMVKDPQGKVVNGTIRKKINKQTGLIFENAKCIKCGLCVRVCQDSIDEPSLCFLERGFVSIISEPIGASFDDVLIKQARKAADICPTGALKMISNKI